MPSSLKKSSLLRRPQGTLFGRNTVAGAVNITSASNQAGDELEGSVSAAYEENDGQIYEGHIGGGISDTLGGRIAFRHRETDGTINNDYLNEPEGAVDETSYRVSLNWQPTDNFSADFKWTDSEYERTGASSAGKVYLTPEQRDLLVPNRSALADTAYNVMDVFFPNYSEQTKKEFAVYKDNGYGQSKADGIGIGKYPDSSNNDISNGVIELNYEMDSGYTMTSVTGYSEYSYADGCDCDWLPLQYIHRDDDQSFEQWSQEIRFTSPGGEFFDYVAGLYYDTSDLEFDGAVTIDTNFDGLFPEFLSLALTGGTVPAQFMPQNLIGALTGGAYSPNQMKRNHYYQLDSESWAAFFQGTFNFSENLRLTVGVRYTEETKEVVSEQFLSDSITGLENPSNAWFLGYLEGTLLDTYTYAYDEDRETDDLLPSLNLQYDIGDSMFYISFSQGFKSGGFSAADDGAPGDLDTQTFPCAPNPDFTVTIENCYDPTKPGEDFEFDDEEVDAYEIGGKHTLLDGGMTLNWAFFYTEYDALQTAVFKGVSFGVKNAASAEIMGIETDIMWAATDNLRIGANFAWLDATYKDFGDGPCTAIQLDVDPLCGTPRGFSGNDLSDEPTLYASDYSAAGFFDYSLDIGNGMEWFLVGEVNYRDDFNSAGDNDPIDVIPSYTKVNLRTGLRGENWELMAYGRNIFDEEAFQQSFDTPTLAGSHSSYLEDGQVWGGRVKFMF